MFCRVYSEFSRSTPRHKDIASLQAEISNAVDGDGGESGDSESSDGKKLYQFSKYYRVRWIGKLACIEPILRHSAALLAYFREHAPTAFDLDILEDSSATGPLAELWIVLKLISEATKDLQSDDTSYWAGLLRA